jgi:hypothetical protein
MKGIWRGMRAGVGIEGGMYLAIPGGRYRSRRNSPRFTSPWRWGAARVAMRSHPDAVMVATPQPLQRGGRVRHVPTLSFGDLEQAHGSHVDDHVEA